MTICDFCGHAVWPWQTRHGLAHLSCANEYLNAGALDALRAKSDAELKALWDVSEPGDPSAAYRIEDIHAVLNERGLGEYCAV
jgi:hypothetical protein